MSAWTVRPGPVYGRCVAPPSKSYTHRALVAAASLGVPLRVLGPLVADDTLATAVGLLRLGYPLLVRQDRWEIGRPAPGPSGDPEARLDCGDSGSTLRFLAPLAARAHGAVVLDGAPGLRRRPVAPLLDALEALGAHVTYEGRRGRLPVRLRGPIRAGTVAVDASESSQFASGLLMALAGLRRRSRIELQGEIVSAPYLDATVRTLRTLGAPVRRRGRTLDVGGPRSGPAPNAFLVPGDASSAAYLWAAAAITGGDVTVEGVGPEWPQADLRILALLRKAGSRVSRHRGAVRVRGRAIRPIRAELTDAPDLVPLVGVVAAGIPGTSRLRGAPHLVLKESDRRAGTIRLVRGLGASANGERDGLSIRGRPRTRALDLRREEDHRLVLSALVGALGAAGPSRVGRCEAIAKSYPTAAADLRSLGADLLGGPP